MAHRRSPLVDMVDITLDVTLENHFSLAKYSPEYLNMTAASGKTINVCFAGCRLESI